MCVSACCDYPFLVSFLVDNAPHGMIEKAGLAGERDDGEELLTTMPTLARPASPRSVEMRHEIPFQLCFSYPD